MLVDVKVVFRGKNDIQTTAARIRYRLMTASAGFVIIS